MADIFQFTDYRLFLKASIDERDEGWGLKAKLARAAGCQRSYFSQVLASRANLTLDQAVGMADLLGLTGDGTTYFMDLVQLDRAGTQALRKILGDRLRDLRHKREDLARRYQAPSLVSGPQEHLYYSAWYWAAIHILTGIPGFNSIDAISQKTALPHAVVQSVLEGLENMGLAAKSKGAHWTNTTRSLHLPRESIMTAMHHLNWRQQAILDVQMGIVDSLHYTSVQSISKKDYANIKHTVLEMLDAGRSQVKASGKEELTCLACDFFVVGK